MVKRRGQQGAGRQERCRYEGGRHGIHMPMVAVQWGWGQQGKACNQTAMRRQRTVLLPAAASKKRPAKGEGGGSLSPFQAYKEVK